MSMLDLIWAFFGTRAQNLSSPVERAEKITTKIQFKFCKLGVSEKIFKSSKTFSINFEENDVIL